ncbi:transposase [Gordonia soli]|uniref:Putative transposase n=1 Tax=Gordonia soli NBRC 108243 TaxID=1223545 RepID=M0QRM7_9ACTN|nr:transposase [Gordonia soli]GAC70197.1 putative transposase [Gordonia soli NBRC 108243]
MPKPYPQEFRDDVVRVARDRGEGVTIEQVTTDFGVHPMTLHKWMRRADIDKGRSPGVTTGESAELREARKRIRLLEQGNEVLRRAAAYLSQANLPGKWLYPLVKELAADGIAVAVACRVLQLSRRPYSRRFGRIRHCELTSAAHRHRSTFATQSHPPCRVVDADTLASWAKAAPANQRTTVRELLARLGAEGRPPGTFVVLAMYCRMGCGISRSVLSRSCLCDVRSDMCHRTPDARQRRCRP